MQDDGTVWKKHSISQDLYSVYAADFDNDGDIDVAGVGENNVSWWENNIKNYGE